MNKLIKSTVLATTLAIGAHAAVADDLALTAVHGRGLHLGNGGPLGLLPPGLARG